MPFVFVLYHTNMRQQRQLQQNQRPRMMLIVLCLLSLAPPMVTSLRILLTNNNGFADEGMFVLRVALETAGHEVYVFAPTRRIDGASAALDLPFVQVTEPEQAERTWLIDGFVATSVLVGISQMRSTGAGDPDLVLSGIMKGYTSGSDDWNSGTLGGALTGLSYGIPSMAILTDVPDLVTETYMSNVAQFVVRLVDTLDDVFSEFPTGVGLKVIYPQTETPMGVVLAGNNNYASFTTEYTLSDTVPNLLEANVVSGNPSDALDPNSDTVLVQQGFVTVLAIKADIALLPSRYNENFLGGLTVLLETMQA
jgi:5'-nucleotidase